MKKILFYGNCHLSSIAKWMHNYYSDKFQILDCTDCGLAGAFGSIKNFTVWTTENVSNQSQYYKCVHEKIKQADFFIFQAMEKEIIHELNTEYLINNVVKNCSICIPNPRFLAYPIDGASIEPYVQYIYNNITKDSKNIIDILLNKYDPEFEKITYEQYEHSVRENKRRYAVHSEKYKNIIDINPFIENQWKNNLLFGTHNHPIGIYWVELIKQIFMHLNESFDQNSLQFLEYANKTNVIDIFSFQFIKRVLPNIIVPESIITLYKADESLIIPILKKNYGSI